jgi:hypothetical protein
MLRNIWYYPQRKVKVPFKERLCVNGKEEDEVEANLRHYYLRKQMVDKKTIFH